MKINSDYSVIIPTYNRRNALIDVLECIAKQTILPLEVIVIDSSDERYILGEAILKKYDTWLRYIRIKQKGNISKQRNLGILKSKGSVILFLDDDVLFGPNLIKDYIDCYKETEADAISGLVLLPGEVATESYAQESNWLFNSGQNNRALNKVVHTKTICTASFSILKDKLLSVGGFDEQMKGTWDDSELGYRLFGKNIRVIHHFKPSVVHLKIPNSGARSEDLGLIWSLSNIFYFHLKHLNHKPIQLLFAASWEYCKPGRKWLHLKKCVITFRLILQALNEAKERIKSGPIYIKLQIEYDQP